MIDGAHLAVLLVCLALLGYGLRLGTTFMTRGIPGRAAIVCLLLSYACLLVYVGWVAVENWGGPSEPRLVPLGLGLAFGLASALLAARSYEQ